MKRFSIFAVVFLCASVLGPVVGAGSAWASSGALEFTDFSAQGESSRSSTLTYGEGLSLFVRVHDDSLSCYNYPHDCDDPTGTVDFWSQLGSPWVDNGPNQTKLSGGNVLVPETNELDPSHHLGVSDADGGIYCCLHPGDYLIRAYYVPGNFDANSATTGITVNKATPTIALEQSSTSTAAGQPVTFTATVPHVTNRLADGPTGSVSFVEGPVGNTTQYGTASVGTDGKASVTTSLIPGGDHSIRAVYTGDTNYAGGQSSVTHTVTKLSTDTTASASPTSTVYGQPTTVTATVTPSSTAPGNPTGTVTFEEVTKPAGAPHELFTTLGTGTLNGSSPDKATFTTSALRVGTHQIMGTYEGDANFQGGGNFAADHDAFVTVAKVHTTTTVITSGSPSTLGQSVTFTAGVVGDYNTVPTGTVQFEDGGSNLGTPQTLFSGQATLTVAGLTGGTHTITAVYAGDANHDGSTSGPLTQTVTCDRVVSGSVSAVTASGTTCLSGATVSGNVNVPAGAKLSLVNSHVSGVISTARGAGAITICGTSVGGNVTITGASGFVLIGDTVEDACAANSLGGSVTLSSNSGGLQLGFNRIGGNVTVTNNVGAGPGPAHTSPEIEANRVSGSLSCGGNSPVASDDGRPNTVSGARSGECASKTF